MTDDHPDPDGVRQRVPERPDMSPASRPRSKAPGV
jgi:hypothetical protein